MFELLETVVPMFGKEPLRSEPPVLAHAPVVLTAEGSDAEEALGAESVQITKFPFVIGRSRSQEPRTSALGCDLYLPDRMPFQLSRRHVAIVWIPSLREFAVKDLGSTLGASVNGVRIGGPYGRDAAVLKAWDNVVVLGRVDSPFRFRLSVPPRG